MFGQIVDTILIQTHNEMTIFGIHNFMKIILKECAEIVTVSKIMGLSSNKKNKYIHPCQYEEYLTNKKSI